jgi:hypothetical protein
MSFSELTGPVIHIGVPLVLAFLFKLNPGVAVLCGLLPDTVDKPLAVLGIGDGRFIGHTLLFAGVTIVLFMVWKRKYALAALTGFSSHLLLDLNTTIPWFYPFKSYHFSAITINVADYLKNYLTFSGAGLELIVVGLGGIIALVVWWIYHRHLRRAKSKSGGGAV